MDVVSLLQQLVNPQQIINALTIGAIYALIALGYTMVYGIIELINFAHGDIFMVGSFVALITITNFFPLITGIFPSIGLQTGTISDIPTLAVALLIVFGITMTVMGLVGVLIERLAYRPLRNAPRLAPLITAIGISFILQNIISSTPYGESHVNVPQLIDPGAGFEFAGAYIRVVTIFILVVAFSLMAGLQIFIRRTNLGRAMRSTALDREAALLMGVDINRTIALTFFIGSALAGAAGVVQGLYFGDTVFNLGFQAGLKAFTAAVLGGIGNTTGAALGGFLIGFIEVYAAEFGYQRWSEAFVFGILVLVLVFRPTGLLGQRLAERA